jgi:hypothetical protein
MFYACFRLNHLEAELETARSSLRASRKNVRKTEVEVERADACFERLREIIRLKNAQDTLKKIFHGMPPAARHPSPHLPAAGSSHSGTTSSRRSRKGVEVKILSMNVWGGSGKKDFHVICQS